MEPDSDSPRATDTLGALRRFAADFVSFAGRRFASAAAFIGLGALFESIGLVLLVPLLVLVTGTGSGNGVIERAGNEVFGVLSVQTRLGRLTALLAAFIVIMILRGAVMLKRDTIVQGLQFEFVEHIRMRILRALASAGWENVLRLRHSRVVQAMGGDIQRISVAAQFLLQSGIALVILAFQCALAFWLAPWLAMLALGLLIAGGFALLPILRRARSLGAFVSEANHTLLDLTGQFLGGLKLAVSQDLQGDFTTTVQATLVALRRRQLDYLAEQAFGRTALTTLSALVGAAAVLVGYGLLGIGAPVLIAFLMIVARMSGPAALIQQGFQQLAFSLPAYEASIDLMKELKTSAVEQTDTAIAFDGAIVLEHVGYRHADGESERGVSDISLRIAPGSFVGITGESGSGKTTLIDLLVGLLRPQSGRILIGDTVLDERTVSAWRSQLSYVTQDSFLFHDSIRRNLLWANGNASESEMWRALALAGAEDVVKRMSGGLDAVVGERGSLVSGGERQRIALARALLRNPRLLVLDEATNAIDVASEGVLLAELAALQPRPTIVIVAHRVESLALCDRVIRLDNGMLVHPEPLATSPADEPVREPG